MSRTLTESVAALAMAAALTMIAAPEAFGQDRIVKFSLGKKKIPVTINHPATLGINLKGKTVAFNPVAGNACRQQFVDSLAEDFGSHGVNLVNRANMDAILREHHFQLDSSTDPASAVEFGKISGAAMMIFVNVTRCDARHSPALVAQQYVGAPINISRTEAWVQASIRTVDLATGRETPKGVESHQQKENQSQGALRPEYPSREEVLDLAVHDAVAKGSRLYFPWTETQEVAFMDSKDCNLKQAYDLLRTGDLDSVLKVSLENVERCKADPKQNHQADALYNLGIAYMLAHDFDHALSALGDSQRLHSDKTVIEAIADCRKAQAGERSVENQQQRQGEDEAERQADEAKRKAAEQKRLGEEAITNAFIIEAIKGGMSDDLLVTMIQSKPAKFSTAPTDLLALRKAGVPDKVIAAMLTKK